MSERLSLQDLTDLLAEKQGLTKKDAELFLRELFDLIMQTIEQKDSVKIKEFGTFKLVKVNSRKSVDVNTGEDIEIPAHYKLSFTPDKTLKDLINAPFAHFESVVLEDGVSFENITFDAENESEDQDTEEEAVPETIITEIEMKEEQEENIEKEINDAVEHPEELSAEIEPAEVELTEETESVADAPVSVAEEAADETEEDDDDDDDDDDEYEPELEESKTTRNVIIVLAILLLVILGYLFKDDIMGAFNGGSGSDTTPVTTEQVDQPDEDALPSDSLMVENDSIAEESVENVSALPEQNTTTPSTATTTPAKEYKPKATITLKSGDTLRKLALTHYGDKTFWVYIYQENIDKIKNFNNIPIGTKLVIPAPEKYDIDVKNAQSLSKAKALEDKYFAK
ncbi:HU family DNA-binding protein [Dysgonomonas sp. 25]|uniref:HU family DNA-binding protein n=1 Tax=Dysgonomonas sp. 25 TaxID=2302933 RepID=UPI0013D23DE3|nr:HU family DNA-binding protein [Dysgonomonas sp. 25]NDV69137.1 HU family DNA-binding protein [Dysgonomonas sp. 25]